MKASWRRHQIGFRQIAADCAKAADSDLKAACCLVAVPVESDALVHSRQAIAEERRNRPNRRNYNPTYELDAVGFCRHQRSELLNRIVREWYTRNQIQCPPDLQLFSYGAQWGGTTEAIECFGNLSEAAGRCLPGDFYLNTPLFPVANPSGERPVPDYNSFWWEFLFITFSRCFDETTHESSSGRMRTALLQHRPFRVMQRAAEWLAETAFEEVESVFAEALSSKSPESAKAFLRGRQANERKNVNARLMMYLTKDPDAKEWQARRLAEALEVAEASIKETSTWKELMKVRKFQKLELAERMSGTGRSGPKKSK